MNFQRLFQKKPNAGPTYIRGAAACALALLLSACGAPNKAASNLDANSVLSGCSNGPTSAAIRYWLENPRRANPTQPFASVLSPSLTSNATISGLSGNCQLQDSYFSVTKDTFYASRIANLDGRTQLFAPSAPEFQQLGAFYYATQVRDLVLSRGLDLSGFTRVSIDAHCNVNNNAYFSPSESALCFGYHAASYQKVWAADDADVVMHETGHAINHVLSSTATLNSSNEAGALDEAIADYWALTKNNNSVLSEWFLASFSASRDASANHLYPADLTSEIHADGRVITEALWELRTSLGATVIDKLVGRTMMLLPYPARFGNFYTTFYAAAALELGAGTTQLAAVRAAFQTRGLERTDSAAGVAPAVAPATTVYVIDDHTISEQDGGNCNGVLDVGETALVLVNLENSGAAMGVGVAEIDAYTSGLQVPAGGGVGEFFRLNANDTFVGSLPSSASGYRKNAVTMAAFLLRATSAGAKTIQYSFTPMYADPSAGAAPPPVMGSFTLTVGSTGTRSSCTGNVWP